MKALRPQKNQNESLRVWLFFKSYLLCVDPKMKRTWDIRWTLVKVTWWWIRLGGHTWSLAVWFSEVGCQYWCNNLYKRNRSRGRGWHHTLGKVFPPPEAQPATKTAWWDPARTREAVTGPRHTARQGTWPDIESKNVKIIIILSRKQKLDLQSKEYNLGSIIPRAGFYISCFRASGELHTVEEGLNTKYSM